MRRPRSKYLAAAVAIIGFVLLVAGSVGCGNLVMAVGCALILLSTWLH